MMHVGSASNVLIQKIPEILKRWEERALVEISGAAGQTSLILRDALPKFLESLARMLSTDHRTAEQIKISAADSILYSKQHGRSRAAIPAYLMSQVIQEYHVLREVLFQALEEKIPVPMRERDIILSALEDATRVAASEFALTLKEVQEQFMLSVAHDLKTPLTAAQTGAELIRRSPKADATGGLAHRVIGQTKRMTELIETMLDTSSIQAGKKLNFQLSSCNLDEIVRDVVGVMKFVFGDLFEVFSEGDIMGSWNPEYLRRTVENIVNNAVKYSSPKSRITLTISQTQEDAKIAIHNFGDPIPPQELEHLFDPFSRTKAAESRKGWGLGLPFVKGVVDALGGSVRVESTKEKGTTFTVTLSKNVKSAQTLRAVG